MTDAKKKTKNPQLDLKKKTLYSSSIKHKSDLFFNEFNQNAVKL